jgi:hypothetical protein
MKLSRIITETVTDLLGLAKTGELADMEAADVIATLTGGVTNIYDRSQDENEFRGREIFTKIFSWSIPCKEAIDTIKKWARPPIYDLMAGTGYWAKLLNDRGVQTVASDIHTIRSKNEYKHQKRHGKVSRKHALKVAHDFKTGRLKGDIILSWPPYEEPIASDVLDHLPTGTRVFYFGEDSGGATGDYAMHVNFNTNFKRLDSVGLPQFQGLHDSLAVWEKIKEEPISAKYRGVGVLPWNDDDDDDDNDGDDDANSDLVVNQRIEKLATDTAAWKSALNEL